MTTLRQAAQQALVALKNAIAVRNNEGGTMLVYPLEDNAINAIKEALAQPQQQAEPPPEWPLVKNILDEYGLDAISFVAEWKAAQRPWVDLTDEDWEWVADKKETSLDTFAHGAAWAADQLKERNT